MAIDIQTPQREQLGNWLVGRAGGDLAEVDAYLPLIQTTDIGKVVKKADVYRREELYSAVEKIILAVLASENEKKVRGIRELLVALMGDQGANALAISAMLQDEIASTSVLKVAGQKATNAFQAHIEKTGIPINPQILEIISQFELIHVLSQLDYDQVKELMPPGVAFLGADVNFWKHLGNGVWTQEHKLERLDRELTDEEFLKLADEMRQFYCYPQSGKVQVMWDTGVVVLNGKAHEFHDQIEIISKPIDEWLFWQYMLEARATGQLYAYNPHFALIECLMANDKIISLATISNEERAASLTIEQKRFKPSEADLEVVKASIKGNRPARIPG